jgi:hypothetical protein
VNSPATVSEYLAGTIKAAALLVALAAISLSGSYTTGQDQWSHSQLHTFTSADGTFTFKYPAEMPACQPDSTISVNGWSPRTSCDGFAPVCRDPYLPDFKTRACVAVPAANYKNSNFEAAALSVLQSASVGETSCLPKKADRSKMIGDIRFEMIHFVGFATGHEGDVYKYRTFHEGSCYQLTITIATNSFGYWPAGTKKKFTEADRKHVVSALTAVLSTFRFTH